MSKPDFSIIIANYNKGDFIAETIESVLNQSYLNFELIIVDDSSTDCSWEIINDYSVKHANILFIQNHERRGANYCRNRGIEEAQNPYLIFLDSDDLLEPYCLEQRSKSIVANPDHDLWVFPMITFSKSKENVINRWGVSGEDLLNRFLSHQLPWTISQPCWKLSFLKEIEGFDLSFSRLQDVELHTRALIHGARVFVNNDKADCCYRISSSRLTWDMNEILEKYIDSVGRFVDKFYAQISSRQHRLLAVTVLFIIDMVVVAFRSGKINRRQANHYMKRVALTSIKRLDSKHTEILLKFFIFFNLNFPFRLHGLRFMVKKML